jgi:hypothetical protein
MPKLKKLLSLRNPATRRTLLIGGAFIVGFIVFSIIGIQVWEYTNSTQFCSYACHAVHPEEPDAYQDSYHARVECVECHMGRVGMLEAMVLKSSHAKHLPATILGQYGRPVEAETLRPANESCELCHWPSAFHGDTVREIKHFESDEQNTEERTYLILKTGGGQRDRGLGFGIHWHIENPVEYIATDEHKQEIPWVRTTLPDGRTVEYNDVANPLSAEEIASSEKRIMDCVDCHNRVGHPFDSPDRLIDNALAEGRVSRDLPYVKKEMLDLLDAAYDDQEAALAAVELMEAQYEAAYPEVAATQADAIQQAADVADELIARVVFDDPGISWQSFPDNSGHGGHRNFPGCFRCHDGKHLTSEGESVRLHCNICHSIPVIVGEGDRPPEMPITSIEAPASHLETSFMADHRFLAGEGCAACHGEIAFGSDDSSFCANSACHGQAWPAVELDAAFLHPIELEGKHAEVWCHDCHEGVEKPSYECANCHEPPMASHFGPVCEDCHTPEGFEQAEMVADFVHPMPLEGAHATLDCLVCHGGGRTLEYSCATCHRPPSEPHFGETCEDCHTTISFAGATIPPELHPIPLVGAHLRATCNVCHADGERVPEYVCTNCHRPPDNHLEGTCDTCHTPEGWADSAASFVTVSPEIPHAVEGLDECLVCHDPAVDIEPVPDSHGSAGYVNEQCRLCHKPASEP